MPSARVVDLRTRFDLLYHQFNLEHVVSDPIWRVRRFTRPEDLEIVAYCAAALAFGRVQSVLQSIDGLLAVMGPSPAAYVRAFDPERDRGQLNHLVHRWTKGADLAALVWKLRQMLDADGSIEGFFARGVDPDAEDVQAGLESFSTRACALDERAVYGRTKPKPGVGYFFSRPSSGGACKRLNLFLRWMVRKDEVDLGVWTRVRPAQLVVPLDTHVIRVGRCLRLTKYTSPGWRMAADITRSLRTIDPADPVKYDFSLCHLGMMNACGFHKPQRDTQCPLRGACRPK
jgi:uncharacterized protein (TIGR02757 family)